MTKALTTDGFIARARNVHGNKYDYSKVKYVNSATKVVIICPIHGEFEQSPLSHLKGRGCRRCYFVVTTDDFIRKAIKIHGNKYDYSKVNYINPQKKVCITCPEHGDFLQEPRKHLAGFGCIMCGYKSESEKKRQSNEWFLEKAKQIHGELYAYSKVQYKGMTTPVEIICPKHGLFLQRPKNHLQGAGCPVCKNSNGEERVSLFLDRNNIVYVPQYKIPNEYLFSKNKKMFVDFYLPKHNTIIEYNGTQHYYETHFWSGGRRLCAQQERDDAVRKYCKDHKIKLIEIPFWKYNNIEAILKKELKIK